MESVSITEFVSVGGECDEDVKNNIPAKLPAPSTMVHPTSTVR